MKLFKRTNQQEEKANLDVNETRNRRRSRTEEISPDDNASAQESRTGHRKAQFQIEMEQKRKKLGRKLNWVIFGLVVAIILAYLFMIFVNF
ncbi:hypothetical protein FC19_GL000819 [Liquorilactobacillus aquaticus DSM 21051]|uniref:Uncharacterized protein n=2 Tax=Liquorilactobacillus aquaticus TaxID=392566 RepID=A0A0R2CXD8_9LACO|nr:hypothetical protein FC19_GL000819 [Liquorilactobacillus aquaticus DSM 21051]